MTAQDVIRDAIRRRILDGFVITPDMHTPYERGLKTLLHVARYLGVPVKWIW